MTTATEEEREHPSPVLASSGPAEQERERVSGLCTELGHARAARGLSRAAIGRKIGVSRAAVSLWELGRQLPDATSLSAWARALGYELALYIPVTNPELTQSTAALLDEVIDVLAKALLGQDEKLNMAHGEIFVQLSVNMADDPKVRALARYGRDARPARDLYVQMICYCKANLTDGLVPLEQIGILAYPDPPKVGARDADRLAEVGLIECRGDAWYLPAFLKRNRSKEAVRDRSEEKRRAGAKANHVRWHAERGVTKPDCEFCQGGSDSDPNSDSNGRSDNASTLVSDHFVNGKEIAKDDTEGSSRFADGSAKLGDITESTQAAPPDPYPNSDPDPSPTGIHIGHRSEDIGHRSIPSDPKQDPPPPNPPRSESARSSAASLEKGEGEDLSPTTDLGLVAKIREIRPDWSTASIARALSRPEVLERPRDLISLAMVAVARDPASQHPGRLAHDGPWWQALPARVAAPPKCDSCNPFRRLEDAAGDDLGPCPTCHPSTREEAS